MEAPTPRTIRQWVWAVTLTALGTLAASASAQDSPWVEAIVPEEGQGNYEALHFITANEGWVLSRRQDGGRLRLDTFDGGETWEVQAIDEDAYRTLLRARFADPLNGWAHADLTGDLEYERVDGHNPGEDNGIGAPVTFLRTTDGGRTWRRDQGRINEVTHFGDPVLAREADRKYLSAVSFANSRVGVMAGPIVATRRRARGEYVVYRGHCLLTTDDGGATWNMHAFGEMLPDDRYDPTWGPPPPIRSIALVGERYARIPADGAQAPLLFRTDNGGQTWEAVTGAPRNAVDVTFGRHVGFTTASNGWSWGFLHRATRTNDGGLTWITLHLLAGGSPAFVNPVEGWLPAAIVEDANPDRVIDSLQGIYHTTDGGETWQLDFATRLRLSHAAYAVAADAVWAYGHEAMFRQVLHAPTHVGARQRQLTHWGALRRQDQE